MAASRNLEYCLDNIENLPSELQINFELLRDLDQRAEDLKAKIDKLTTEYMSSFHNVSSEERMTVLKQIQEAYSKCKEYSEIKVQIATQIYEMVDENIQKLDIDLARIEAEQKQKQTRSRVADRSPSKRKRNEEEGGPLGEDQTQMEKAACALSKDKKSEDDLQAVQQKLDLLLGHPEHGMSSGTSGSSSPLDVMDMPVDPYEPTYCLCHQVSYGVMIGCDNPDCAIEWFHFPCVGLTAKPRGKWFCPDCSPKQKK